VRANLSLTHTRVRTASADTMGATKGCGQLADTMGVNFACRSVSYMGWQ
jgi:hypothetical protein